MGGDVDSYARLLLEQAKRFLEKAKEKDADSNECSAFLNSSLLIGFSALEAHINSIADDFSERDEFSLLEKSIILEKEFRIHRGKIELHESLKIYRLQDRVQLLFQKFSRDDFDFSVEWWSQLSAGLKKRNEIVHPKGNVTLNITDVEFALRGILGTLDALFKTVYRRKFPAAARGLTSNLNF